MEWGSMIRGNQGLSDDPTMKGIGPGMSEILGK
jgi:hypothetical protein